VNILLLRRFTKESKKMVTMGRDFAGDAIVTSSFALKDEASYRATDSLRKPRGSDSLTDFLFYPNTEVGSTLSVRGCVTYTVSVHGQPLSAPEASFQACHEPVFGTGCLHSLFHGLKTHSGCTPSLKEGVSALRRRRTEVSL